MKDSTLLLLVFSVSVLSSVDIRAEPPFGFISGYSPTNPVHWQSFESNAVPADSSAGPPMGGLELALRFEKKTYVRGEKILAIVTLRNRSTNIQDATWFMQNVNFSATNSANRSEELTETGRRFSNPNSYLNVAMSVSPGKQMEHSVPIQDWFTFGTDGQYTIQARQSPRMNPNGPCSGIAVIEIIDKPVENAAGTNAAPPRPAATTTNAQIISPGAPGNTNATTVPPSRSDSTPPSASGNASTTSRQNLAIGLAVSAVVFILYLLARKKSLN